jgi:predicted nuclease of restriction endonuclease-like RecB superfamily
MLLPFDCLAYRITEGRLLPSWLGEADEPFVASVLDAATELVGLQVAEADLVAPNILARAARAAKMPLRIAEALWVIERRRWDARVDAPIEPEALRDLVFELASRLPREAAIAEAARRLGIASEMVVGSLFADRQTRRVLAPPEQRSDPAELVARYNLALVQALLARSMEIDATIVGDASAIAVAAKRDGLLARFDVEGETTHLTLTGPLALFHDTVKYGRMIARFVPALVTAPSWSLTARVTLGPRSADLALDHNGAIAFGSTLPAAPDGRLARRVARALRSVGVRVDLHPAAVRAGSSLVLPDFALEWSRFPRSTRVLVDVVPFATPEYLACKLESIAALDEPMLVCVDERFASIQSPSLLPYRSEIDAFALYAAARRAVDATITPSRAGSSLAGSSLAGSSLAGSSSAGSSSTGSSSTGSSSTGSSLAESSSAGSLSAAPSWPASSRAPV